METIIEILTPEKWQVLKDLWLRALAEDPTPFGSSYEEESVLSDDEWKKKFDASDKYVARVGDAYVGLVGVTYNKKVRQEHSVDINGFYVLPEFQGKGIGRKLLERVIADMHAKPGIIRLRIFVDVERKNAIKLYSDLGFVETGISPKAIFDGTVYHDHAQMVHLFEDKL